LACGASGADDVISLTHNVAPVGLVQAPRNLVLSNAERSALSLFRKGNDTAMIAKLLGETEAKAYSLLHSAREIERAVR
jgi:hypothetical protein